MSCLQLLPLRMKPWRPCAGIQFRGNRVNAFHMDEYAGLDESHPAGFRNFLKRAIFDRYNFHSINLIDGNAADLEAAMRRYDELLEAHPLDICILGIGENGHIAFNDPDVADFNDPVRVKKVKLDEKCRMQQVHDGCFHDISEVPTHAVTVTVPALCAAAGCSVPFRQPRKRKPWSA